MGMYRARDLLKTPSLLSMARIPLAIAFYFAIETPLLAAIVLALAGTTDVADGWYARRFNQVTATGTVVDPITDKLFVAVVAFTLLSAGKLSLVQIGLLGVREIGELPLVVWAAFSRRARRARKRQPSANAPGKFATVLQFATVAAALAAPAQLTWMLYVTAVCGLVAATSYWIRTLEWSRQPTREPLAR